MDYIPGLLLVALIIALIYVSFIIFRKRKEIIFNQNANSRKEIFEVATSQDLEVQSSNEIIITLEQLSLTTIPADNQLVEISDKSVIARITDTFPHVAEVAAKTIKNNDLAKMDVYKVIIPSGKELVKSKDMGGAVRAFFRGSKGIEGQANLVKIDLNTLSKSGDVANVVANVMNVGSLVVGQYYMAEIDAKLEVINQNIDKIADFQEREFKSRILSLIAQVRTMSSFSKEIIENDELRKRKLQTLDNLEGEAIKLLQQVNLAIDELTKKNQTVDYKDYRKLVDEFSVQVHYQQALVSIMEEISKLIYFLGKGEISPEMSYSSFNLYLEQSTRTRNGLLEWHNKHLDSLGIDMSQNRIRRRGLEGVMAEVPAVIDKKWKYKTLQDGLVQKISSQTMTNQLLLDKPKDIYDQDVQLVIKEGKYFYFNDHQIS